jgi:hypothetical protein
MPDRNAVMEIQKCTKSSRGGTPHTLFLRKLSMTVAINQKKLYYNCYTSDKFLTLKFKFQVKSPGNPPPPPYFRCFATSLKVSVHNQHTTLNLAVVRVYEKGNPPPLCSNHVDKFQPFFSALIIAVLIE